MNNIEAMGLPLMEAFYTVQGEGYHQGRAAYFVRLAGCDVGCVWCDVKESWDPAAHKTSTVAAIVEGAVASGAHLAVITGGEPLMYDLGALTKALKNAGFKIHLETSGAHPLSGTWDWICLSPKKFSPPLQEILEKADELKIIVYNKSDFKWGELYRSKVRPGCRLYLQPEWSRDEQVMPDMVDYVKDHPDWQISLQIHKFMNVP